MAQDWFYRRSTVKSAGPSATYTRPGTYELYDFDPTKARLVAYKTPITPGGNPYVGIGTSVVHPCAVYKAAGWNGYKYWLAYTPYPLSDNQYENPCLTASNDGVTWVDLGASCNPVAPKPGGYNSDTHCVFSRDGTKLYVIWRDRSAGVNTIYCSETTNGTTFSVPVALVSGLVASQDDYTSPSVFWDHTHSRWCLLALNQDNATEPYPMREVHSSGADIYTGWSAPATVTLSANPGTGKVFWHSWFTMLPSGRVIGFMNETTSAAPAAGPLYMCTGTVSSLTVTPFDAGISQHYRSTFIMKPNGVDFIQAGIGLASWYRWVLSEEQATQCAMRRADLIAASNGTKTALLYDNFNRADGAITTAPSGHTWTNAGPFAVVSNAAESAVGNSRMYADIGTADFEYAASCTQRGASANYIVFRLVDSSNYWRAGGSTLGGSFVIQKIVSGTPTSITLDSLTKYPNDATRLEFRVVCNGNTITVYINDNLIHSFTDTTFSTATKVGLQGAGATPARFDWVVARALTQS